MREPLISVNSLKTHFPVRRGLFSRVVAHVRAVDGVSFDIFRGETLSIVGESGCGKTTLGRTLLRLTPATSGKVMFSGIDLLSLDDRRLREMRRRMQIVFQDPYSSLNPRMSVVQMLREMLTVAGGQTREQADKRVLEILNQVGLSGDYANRYPHEFSGGQRQRIAIARAIAINPEFLVCDEPVSALDVSIQSQIINLLMDLKEAFNLTYLFISHDLKVVEHISDRVGVMYLGKIVELSESESLFSSPMHPYTRALLSAAPSVLEEDKKERIILKGEIPSAINIPDGCRFRARCWKAGPICTEISPELQDCRDGHLVACHFPG